MNSFHLFLDHAADYWPVLAAIVASIPGIIALRIARRKQDLDMSISEHSENVDLATKWQNITDKSTIRNNMLQDRIVLLELEVERLRVALDEAGRENLLNLRSQEEIIENLKIQIVGLEVDLKKLRLEYGTRLSAETIRANTAERKLEEQKVRSARKDHHE